MALDLTFRRYLWTCLGMAELLLLFVACPPLISANSDTLVVAGAVLFGSLVFAMYSTWRALVQTYRVKEKKEDEEGTADLRG